VSVGGSAALFAAAAAWKLGLPGAGRRLVAGLGSDDEQERLIAGMLLVRAGERAVPLLRGALEHPRHLPHLLRVIGDAAPKAFAAELERYAASDDPAVRRAAQDALRAAAAAGTPGPTA
jgi:hypothetical protein